MPNEQANAAIRYFIHMYRRHWTHTHDKKKAKEKKSSCARTENHRPINIPNGCISAINTYILRCQLFVYIVFFRCQSRCFKKIFKKKWLILVRWCCAYVHFVIHSVCCSLAIFDWAGIHIFRSQILINIRVFAQIGVNFNFLNPGHNSSTNKARAAQQHNSFSRCIALCFKCCFKGK